MDAVLLNIIGDIPIVTKVWATGCIGVSLLAKSRVIDPYRRPYAFDLVFKKGQYERLIYSLFDYGDLDWGFIFNIFLSVNQLTSLENSFPNKRRYCWMILLLLMGIIAMTAAVDNRKMLCLAQILRENLMYYQIRKNENDMNFLMIGGLNLSPLVIPLYMNVARLLQGETWLGVAMNVIPAHLLYYCDDLVNKLYQVDLLQTPYDYIVNRRLLRE